jgi:hypothetical protein
MTRKRHHHNNDFDLGSTTKTVVGGIVAITLIKGLTK